MDCILHSALFWSKPCKDLFFFPLFWLFKYLSSVIEFELRFSLISKVSKYLFLGFQSRVLSVQKSEETFLKYIKNVCHKEYECLLLAIVFCVCYFLYIYWYLLFSLAVVFSICCFLYLLDSLSVVFSSCCVFYSCCFLYLLFSLAVVFFICCVFYSCCFF